MFGKQQQFSSEQLEAELRKVTEDVREAIRNGNEELLIKLRARQDVLPVQILDAKITEAESELAEVEASIERIREEREGSGEAMTEARARRDEAQKALKAAEEAVISVQCAINRAGTAIDRAGRTKREIAGRIESLKAELDSYIESK